MHCLSLSKLDCLCIKKLVLNICETVQPLNFNYTLLAEIYQLLASNLSQYVLISNKMYLEYPNKQQNHNFNQTFKPLTNTGWVQVPK